MKKALISGILGQDGSYLSELLLSKGYKVYGIDRRVSIENTKYRYSRVSNILKDIELLSGDIRDYARMFEIINKVKPDELYHLAAQSHVNLSFKDEFTILEGNIKGTINILNIIRAVKPECKYYHASTSELFGKVTEMPQKESTTFNPVSPYAIGKLHSHYYGRMYREAYGMFCCNGILFNHESPRRPVEFVTRKITNAVARIKLGKQKELKLGNLNAKRDWGYAADFIYAMYLMLQQPIADDYVIATGETHTVREFCEIAFNIVGLNYKDYVVVDPKFFRPCEVNILLGDPTKAKNILGWKPKVTFKELIIKMVEHDLKMESCKCNT